MAERSSGPDGLFELPVLACFILHLSGNELVSDPEVLVARDSRVRNFTYRVQGKRTSMFIFLTSQFLRNCAFWDLIR